jgi:hypothetical protein
MNELLKLRKEKIKLYNQKKILERELKIKIKNNDGPGEIMAIIDDINYRLKLIDKRMKKILHKNYNYCVK